MSNKSTFGRVVRRKRVALPALALAGATALSLGGVATSSAATARGVAKAGKNITIALVPGLTTDPFYITMHAGAALEAKKLGAKLIWQGGTTFSPTTQLPVVNSLLAEHPSALLIAPTDVVALKAPIQKFVKAHIPVISVDTTINDTSLLVSRITSNNFQGGEQAAATIAKLAHYQGQVAVDNVNPGISTTDARQAGFLAQIKKYPHMSVAAVEYNQDSPTLAASQTKNLVLKYPKLVGIFGTNLYGAQGAGQAIAAAGKKGKIFVAAYDAEPATVKLLRQGVINVLVIQQPAVEGADAVRFAVDFLTGHKNLIPKSVLVPNIVATTATASNPNITKYFYKTSFSG